MRDDSQILSVSNDGKIELTREGREYISEKVRKEFDNITGSYIIKLIKSTIEQYESNGELQREIDAYMEKFGYTAMASYLFDAIKNAMGLTLKEMATKIHARSLIKGEDDETDNSGIKDSE